MHNNEIKMATVMTESTFEVLATMESNDNPNKGLNNKELQLQNNIEVNSFMVIVAWEPILVLM